VALVEWDLASFRTPKFVGHEGSLMELHADGGLQDNQAEAGPQLSRVARTLSG
jgi:hypothetical protein